MPTYFCSAPAGLLDASKKSAIAAAITRIHNAVTGAASTPLYKYVDIAGLKRILQGSIRFTQPSAFNDPFELLPEVVVPNDAGEKQLSFSFDVRAKRRQPLPGAGSGIGLKRRLDLYGTYRGRLLVLP